MKIKQDKWLKAITVALDLCKKHSFHGTSMDIIAENARLSKATIYKYFKTKENLLYETLKYHAEAAIERNKKLLLDRTHPLKERVSQRFEDLRKAFLDQAYFGCYYQLAYSEYAHENKAIQQMCADYKSGVQSVVETMLINEGIEDATLKSKELEMLFNGLLSTLYMTKEIDYIDLAKVRYIKQIFE